MQDHAISRTVVGQRFTKITSKKNLPKKRQLPKLTKLPTYSKKIFFKRKNLLCHLKKPDTWHSDRAHPKKKFLPENCFKLASKREKKNRKVFYTHLKKVHPRRSYLSPQKMPCACLKKKKPDFPNKNDFL